MSLENVHPSLIEALKLDAERVPIADGPFLVLTRSGSVYRVEPNGLTTGGRHFNDGEEGDAWGAAYRLGGPITMNHIVVGLGLEIHWTSDASKATLTTPVEAIYEAD